AIGISGKNKAVTEESEMLRVVQSFALMFFIAVLVACGSGGGGTTANTPSNSGSASSGSASNSSGATPATIAAAITALDTTLPADPSLTLPAVCATLQATLMQSAFSSPTSTDPSIDANPINSNPDTAAIQNALNACTAGQAVKLVTNGALNAFLTGPLTLPSGVTLWVDSGVTLYASRNAADYDSGSAGFCGGAYKSGVSPPPSGSGGCKALIAVPAGATNSGVIGLGAIDGRGGSVLTGGPVLTINSTPFPTAGKMTWWDVAMLSKLTPTALSQNCPVLLDLTKGGSNFTMWGIALLNSPHFHVKMDSYNGFTAWGVQVLSPTLAYADNNYACTATGHTIRPTGPASGSPATSPSTCFTPDDIKNTDGIDPGGSNNVTIAYSYISDGDDNVAITASNSNSCVTLNPNNSFCSSTNTKIAHNHFYYGHGMSVGSGTEGGVSGLQVWDLSIDGKGSSNGAGLRIKSSATEGGSVSATYTKVCIQNEKQPIVIDPNYSSTGGSSLFPDYHDISFVGIHAVTLAGAKYPNSTNWNNVIDGYNASFMVKNLILDNVYFDTSVKGDPAWGNSAHPGVGYVSAAPNYANIVIGSGSTNFAIPTNGASVTVTGTTGTATAGNAVDCTSAFPAFSSVNPLAPI
ncbi:MAG TPA: glycosyl hydrolase family 28 protein, partial [Rhodocyclaceae bacterium]|nr:glycosyl hydrolase family 28 protein [Rhodocyclaceae bacterium]